MQDKQIKSRKRVADHGEVFTNIREVNAMLDLVKQETERIESRFLEPACGSGNFLIEVLNRKLDVIIKKYKKSQLDYERYSVIAISSIYGIDILKDNVIECRNRLFNFFKTKYEKDFRNKTKEEVLESVKFILTKNIVLGDALTMKDTFGNPIIMSEWSAVNGIMMKRREFSYANLIESADLNSLPMFSDLQEEVWIPKPVKEYPLCSFLKIKEMED